MLTCTLLLSLLTLDGLLSLSPVLESPTPVPLTGTLESPPLWCVTGPHLTAPAEDGRPPEGGLGP